MREVGKFGSGRGEIPGADQQQMHLIKMRQSKGKSSQKRKLLKKSSEMKKNRYIDIDIDIEMRCH